MTVTPEFLRHHLAYSAWANNRLFSAVDGLTAEERVHDFATADKSVIGTLAHIYRAERHWIARIREGTPQIPFREPRDDEWSALQSNWPRVQAEWRTWAEQLQDAESILSYTDLRGNKWSHPLWAIVMHVVNHSTHHRGQISGFLRALGKTPPSLDLIGYVREQGALKSRSE